MNNHLNFLNFQGTHIYIRHIFLLYWGHKTIKKTANSSLRRRLIFRENNHTSRISAFNFRWFQQPIRSCGIVLTANQRYGQNLAVTSTNVREFVSGPILAVAVRENVWEPLKLGLISGYHIWACCNQIQQYSPVISVEFLRLFLRGRREASDGVV